MCETSDEHQPIYRTCCVSGFVVNGQIIGVKGRNNNTYFGRLGISHPELGVRLEVSTDNISVFHDGKNVTLLWSDTELIKEAK